MFEIHAYYKIVYKNKDYTKIITGEIIEEDNNLLRVIDKFGTEVIIGKKDIIESKKLGSRNLGENYGNNKR